MKLRILDTEYDITDAVNHATLNDLMQLKVKTKSDTYDGVSVKTIKTTFETMGQRAQQEGFDTVELLDDPVFLLNMVGVMWLARRRNGESITVEEAGKVTFNDFQFIGDDPAEEEAEDPDAPFSEAADAAPSSTPTSTNSTT